jgi:biopolymer transport protein ExbB
MSNRMPLIGLAAVLSLAPGGARAWWNGDWTGRKPIRIDASPAGANVADPTDAVPVLVRLHAGNFPFAAAKEDGSDLRFVAADDKTPLKHHLERYDALLGEALVWVGLPRLEPGGRAELFLYFGNPKAVSAEDPKGTYDAGTALVYHFAERGQPARDTSTWANHAATTAGSADGALIGSGVRLDGTKAITVPAGPSLAWAPGAPMTWSAWIKPAEAEASGVIFARRDGGNALRIGLEGGKPFVEVDRGSGFQRATGPVPIPANAWHHLAVTAGQGVALLVDGAPAARLDGALPALASAATIGADPTPPAPAEAPGGRKGREAPPAPAALPGFKGDLDELQIAKVERPAGSIRLAAISQGTDPGKLVVYGPAEETGGGGSGYLAILVKSVTLDGWVVIGLLGVMAVVSWVVMVGKASYLSAAERANDRFTERFRQMDADLAAAVRASEQESKGDDRELRDSPLHRIFRIGAQEVHKRTSGGRRLTAEAVEAIRASLDAGLVRESQRLTRRMVLLTIAISGGPFLGLLGTVVGVMITFAAIAAAGDVNVNAIAPGIAAALVATVAGLAVAIPALFGYNWLLTRIKDLTASMQVFVDELVTRIAEAYAGADGHERAQPRPHIAAAE